jgi:hypothetical protein
LGTTPSRSAAAAVSDHVLISLIGIFRPGVPDKYRHIRIIYCYRFFDSNHVFSTKDIPGLIVSNPDLRAAYAIDSRNAVIPADQFVNMVQGPISVWAATVIVFDLE